MNINMMGKILLISLLAFFAIAPYKNTFSHGGDRTYKFDKKDNTADQEAMKRAEEKRVVDENWDDFMSHIEEKEATGTKTKKDTKVPDSLKKN